MERRAALLEARGIGKRFGGVRALDGVDLALASDELVGLVGPNGAGKTTAFNVLTGVVAADAGSVRLDGHDITAASPETRARLGMTRTFQNVRLFDELTVRQNVMAGAHARAGASTFACLLALPAHRRAERRIGRIADEALERTSLAALAPRRADTLPYGDRRRVEIARALAADPRLLLLDEPAAGMSGPEKRALRALVERLNAERGLAIVIVEHDVPLIASLCPRTVVVHEGRVLADGATREVLAREDVAEVYLGRRQGRTEGRK